MEIFLVLLLIGKVIMLALQPYAYKDKDVAAITTVLNVITLILSIIIVVMYAATMWPIGTAFPRTIE